MKKAERLARALCTAENVNPDVNWRSRLAKAESVLAELARLKEQRRKKK